MRADHATACVGQNITRHLGQTEYVVEFKNDTSAQLHPAAVVFKVPKDDALCM